MFPSLTANNQTNKNVGNIELAAEFGFGALTCSEQAANLFDLPGGEFRFSVLLANWREKVAEVYRVMDVVLLRRPFQVFKAIIRLISVLVVRDHTVRTWADEGFEHQDVDKLAAFLSVLAKRHSNVASLSRLGIKDISRINSPNTSNIANFIDALVSDYRFPDFHWSLLKCKRHQAELAVATRQEPDGVIAKIRMLLSASVLPCSNMIVPRAHRMSMQEALRASGQEV